MSPFRLSRESIETTRKMEMKAVKKATCLMWKPKPYLLLYVSMLYHTANVETVFP